MARSKQGSEVLFTSVFTPDYEAVTDRLCQCCDKYGLRFEPVAIPDVGGWRKNCSQKPAMLLKKWEQHDGPVVLLDADCVIHKDPVFLRRVDHPYDVILRTGTGVKVGYIGSAVSWWNRTDAAHAVLRRWASECDARPRMADKQLKTAMLNTEPVTLGTLPPEYFVVYWRNKGVQAEDIVISCNERHTIHKDGHYDRKRKRKYPLTLEHKL